MEYNKDEDKKEKNVFYEDYIRNLFEYQKIEVDLYWKRATYFWTLIGAIFVGYFSISNNVNSNIQWKLLIESLGVIFSFCWYLVNRGSKYWDKHWINKIKELEKNSKNQLFDYSKKKYKILNLFSPYSFAVTKINLILSFLIFLLWIILFVFDNIKNYQISFNITISNNNVYSTLLNVFTLLSIILLLIFGRMNKRDN